MDKTFLRIVGYKMSLLRTFWPQYLGTKNKT